MKHYILEKAEIFPFKQSAPRSGDPKTDSTVHRVKKRGGFPGGVSPEDIDKEYKGTSDKPLEKEDPLGYVIGGAGVGKVGLKVGKKVLGGLGAKPKLPTSKPIVSSKAPGRPPTTGNKGLRRGSTRPNTTQIPNTITERGLKAQRMKPAMTGGPAKRTPIMVQSKHMKGASPYRPPTRVGTSPSGMKTIRENFGKSLDHFILEKAKPSRRDNITATMAEIAGKEMAELPDAKITVPVIQSRNLPDILKRDTPNHYLKRTVHNPEYYDAVDVKNQIEDKYPDKIESPREINIHREQLKHKLKRIPKRISSIAT
tara:strand:+ start:1743 stop:2678 length:936 start_codon:yes stop_codon:yes gene_type:complete